MSEKFTKQELQVLQSLVGQRISFVGGPNLTDFMVSSQVIVVAQNTSVSVKAVDEIYDFTGESDDYVSLRVSKAKESDFTLSKERNFVYKLHANELILDVQIVSEKITSRRGLQEIWSFESDVSIIFICEKGALAITLEDHHMSIVRVSSSDELQSLAIPETMSLFEDSLLETFSVTRETRSVSELMA
ncbi:MAG: hypothetical protein ACKOWE_06180 [Micrococcales bacterium]